MIRRTMWAFSLVAALSLAGCGEDEKPRSNDEPSDSSTPSPSETEETATTQQYASIVAQNQELEEHIETMSGCDWLGSGRLDNDPALVVCSIGLLSLSLAAQSMELSLQAAADVTAPGYIGAPPAELESLIADTRTSADALAKAAEKASDAGCGETGAGKCSRLRIDTWQAMNDVEDSLQGWRPYL